MHETLKRISPWEIRRDLTVSGYRQDPIPNRFAASTYLHFDVTLGPQSGSEK
jgi:hypothetical protein